MKNIAIEEMKAGVAEKMEAAGTEAIIWSEATFSATGLPLISSENGATESVHGIMRNSDATLSAITGAARLPEEGVIFITPGRSLPADIRLSSAGTPQQWAVICDCFESVEQMHKAAAIKNERRPWW